MKPGASPEEAVEAISRILEDIVSLPRHRRRVPVADPRIAFDEDEEELDPKKVERLTDKARGGDIDAEATLRKLVELALSWGYAPHKSLHPYILERLREGPPTAPRGHPGEDISARDWLLYVAVERLRKVGFHPTRNRANRTESACSFLKKVLADRGYGIGERAIEDAWKRMKVSR